MMMQDQISSPPPSAPMTMASLAPTSPGGQQIGGAAMHIGLQIDQALKLLAQAVPQLLPWVERVTSELRTQLGTALQSGVPTTPARPEFERDRFPLGSAGT